MVPEYRLSVRCDNAWGKNAIKEREMNMTSKKKRLIAVPTSQKRVPLLKGETFAERNSLSIIIAQPVSYFKYNQVKGVIGGIAV